MIVHIQWKTTNVVAMSYETRHALSLALRPLDAWKRMADSMGYTNQEILNFELKKEPVMTVLNAYQGKEGASISNIYDILVKIERRDVLSLFDGYKE